MSPRPLRPPGCFRLTDVLQQGWAQPPAPHGNPEPTPHPLRPPCFRQVLERVQARGVECRLCPMQTCPHADHGGGDTSDGCRPCREEW